MRLVHRIDENGKFVENLILQDNEKVPADCVDIPMPQGIFLPAKLKDGQWSSTLTPEEIEALKNPVLPKTQLEILQETVDQLVLDNLMRGF